MKKTVVGIFAHPDDESFGPAGTIALSAKENDVYVLCATRGEAGLNNHPDQNRLLAEIREKELRQSAKILGVKEVYFLDFIDGTLSNSNYHRLAEKIQTHLEKIRPHTIITFEPRGVSGHIDHIVVSMVTSFIFRKLLFIKTLMYYCLNEKQTEDMNNYFIYFPPGYKKAEIDKVIDISSVWDLKITAVKMHKSQIEDVKRVIKRLNKYPKVENFLIKTK